jgi:hypothetical protein
MQTAFNILGKMCLRFFAAGMLACFAAAALLAVTPDAYLQQIDFANDHISALLESVAKSELSRRDTEHENYLIAQIGRTLPRSETVEWPGSSVETSNEWLYDEMEAFANAADPSKRALILTGISERLTALSERIEELNELTVGSRSKDEDKQKLAEILRREEYQKSAPQNESMIRRWVRQFFEWLDSLFPKPKITPAQGEEFGSFRIVLQLLIYAVVIGLVGFLVYRFAPFLSQRFFSRTRTKRSERVILGERIGDDESADDLFSEAERLARDGNIRGAIRKGYIAFLCELSDRNLIGLARHKTNRDYLRDVRRNETLFENMRGLTGDFELNWYGLRSAEDGDWENFRALYKKTMLSAAANRPDV